jgi:hypothetical protein
MQRMLLSTFPVPSSQRQWKNNSSLRPQRLCLPYEIHVNEERSGFHWGGEYFFKHPFLYRKLCTLAQKVGHIKPLENKNTHEIKWLIIGMPLAL